MDSETLTAAETKRDRVRRLFITPMIEHGWRKPPSVKQEAHDALLVKLADGLGYLTDHNFARLRAVMQTKGTGPRLNNWPTLATIMSFAQVAQPRPIDEVPGLLSWFRSAAGAQAELQGRLVEEYGWWCKHHSPPYLPGHMRLVASRAAENRQRATLIEDQVRRGGSPMESERAWLAHYRAREAHVRSLMDGGA